MPAHSGSIRHQLQLGFGLAALLLSCLMAVFMNGALEYSLEREDAQVLEGQAQAILRLLAEGRPQAAAQTPSLLEKAEWRLLDARGQPQLESPGMAAIPSLAWPKPGLPPVEVQGPRSGTFSVMVRQAPGPDQGRLLLAMDRSHEAILLGRFRGILALAVVGSGVLAAIIGGLLASWGLKPLRRIIQETSDISGSKLDRRLDDSAFPQELQELVATLNGTLARLQGAFQRLDQSGAELAHELRTPLQNLRGTLENLALGPGLAEPQRTRLGGLLEDCDRMEALIEQIFFLARSEDPRAGLALRTVTAADLLEESRAFFDAAAEEAGVTLAWACPPELALAGDSSLLLRALHNLVANALKHTPAGGRVTLGAAPAGAGVALWVVDTGSGIPAEWLPRLGQPFVRGPEAAGAGGLGLGLAIVKRIAQLHGGEVTIASDAGQGTRVALIIPNP